MSKEERYDLLYRQIESLVAGETNRTGILANISAAMKEMFPKEYFWVGFYLVDTTTNTLQLGPFQGTVACYTIPFGKGVCGSAWAEKHTIVVPDVEAFPGHIACSSLSRSEIVVPIFTHHQSQTAFLHELSEGQQHTVWAVLDIDSTAIDTFDDTDRRWLERIVTLL